MNILILFETKMEQLSIPQKEKAIIDFLTFNNYIMVYKIQNLDMLNIVHDLYINHIVIDEIPNIFQKEEYGLLCSYISIYYQINHETFDMLKYLILGVEKDDDTCICGLFAYCLDKRKSIRNVTKYGNMSLNKNNIIAMGKYGSYYFFTGNYDEMKKYFDMSYETCQNINTELYYGGENNKKEWIEWLSTRINNYLSLNFDVNYAIKYSNLLNERNSEKYKVHIQPDTCYI